MSRFLGWYGTTYNKWPYTLAFITCYIKGSIADCVTQSKFENYGRCDLNNDEYKNKYWFNKMDWKRNIKFSLWSAIYCGSIQHYLYNILYPSIFIGHSLKISLYKSMCDSFICAPFFSMPLYFTCKAIFLGDSWKDGINNYKQETWIIMKNYWKIWLPVITLVLFLVPLEFRIATIGCVSLLWLMILSWLSPYTHNKMKYFDEDNNNNNNNNDIVQY